MRQGLAALLLALVPGVAAAQERDDLPSLPRDVQERVHEMRADESALRLSGPVVISADSTVAGDLVVEDGTLTLAGRVTGDVLVVRGDLVLEPGSAIGGDVLVVAGGIRGIEAATVSGTLVAHGPTEAARARTDEHEREERRGADEWKGDHDRDDDADRRDRRRRRDEGGLDLGLSVAGNYNRVEGLPIMFGPVIESAGPNRLHLSGQAIWRTEPSASLDDEIGYRIRLEQGLFGDRLRIGGDARSMVRAIEAHGLNSTEAGLAAALFHSDLHDYYQEQSWAARIELRPGRVPVAAQLTYREADHGVVEESD